MPINDYLRVLRKHWFIVLGCVALGVGAAAAFAWHATPKYQASSQLFVAVRDSVDANELAQGGQFTQQRVQSYADIIDSPQVTGPVARKLNDGLTADEIAGEISASAPLNTVLVNVNVTDTSPERAQLIANAVGAQFAKYAARLETTAGSSTSPVKVTVVKKAQVPTAPASPRKKLDVLLGLLIGIAVGAGGAIARDRLDTTIASPEEIQEISGSGVIGTVIFDSDAKQHPLVVAEGCHPRRSEAFRQLRTNLQFVNVDSPPRSIVFTSSVAEEGKTATVCNLAITLAQAGTRVLFIEGDLRRPRATNYLGLVESVGLTNVLVGAVSLRDVTQSWGNLPLHVLAAGPRPPNPSELLASRGMSELLRQAKVEYDIVLLDAPPLLPVTDAAVIASQVDGAVVVIRHGKTRRDQLARSVAALTGANGHLLGCVLNMAPSRGAESYDYGYAGRQIPLPAAPTPGPAINLTPTEPAQGG